MEKVLCSNHKGSSKRLLPYIMMIYATTLVSTGPFVNKIISIGPLFTSAAVITFPITFILADVVAEVYGYSVARRMIWTGLFCQFLFAVLSVLIVKMPYPSDVWKHNGAYTYVLGNLLYVYFSALVSAPVGDFTNIYILSKLKLFTRGKYFWLRSVASIAIGQLAYTIICATLIFYNTLNSHSLIVMIFTTYLITILYVTFLSSPGAFLAKIIKRIEKSDVYDYTTDFNPFKWSDQKEVA